MKSIQQIKLRISLKQPPSYQAKMLSRKMKAWIAQLIVGHCQAWKVNPEALIIIDLHSLSTFDVLTECYLGSLCRRLGPDKTPSLREAEWELWVAWLMEETKYVFSHMQSLGFPQRPCLGLHWKSITARVDFSGWYKGFSGIVAFFPPNSRKDCWCIALVKEQISCLNTGVHKSRSWASCTIHVPS